MSTIAQPVIPNEEDDSGKHERRILHKMRRGEDEDVGREDDANERGEDE